MTNIINTIESNIKFEYEILSILKTDKLSKLDASIIEVLMDNNKKLLTIKYIKNTLDVNLKAAKYIFDNFINN